LGSVITWYTLFNFSFSNCKKVIIGSELHIWRQYYLMITKAVFMDLMLENLLTAFSVGVP
jgi:hypothetical protein